MSEQAKKTPAGANAPYAVKRRDGEWVVVNNTGEVKAKFGQDRDKAVRYMRALYANVPGAAKRAAKVPYTGKAKDRVAAVDVPGPHPAVARPGSKQCVVCGMEVDNPIHQSQRRDMAADDVTEGPANEADDQTGDENSSDGHTGVMVALFPPRAVAESLVLDGDSAEPVEDLHLTLAFLGETDDYDESQVETMRGVVQAWASQLEPIEARLSGSGVFNNPGGEGGDTVTYASVDAPLLPAVRQRLIRVLTDVGLPPASNHGFTPHITLAYRNARVDVPSREFTFGQVTLAVGDARYDYDFTGVAPSEGQPVEAASEPITMKDGKYPISDQKSANSAWRLRNHSDSHSEAEVIAHIRRACKALGLKFPGDNAEKAVETQAEAAKLAQGVDATIDQALVLLRSTPDLPDNAAQARDLLQGLEEACDALLEYFDVSDSDEAEEADDDRTTLQKLIQQQATQVAASAAALAENAKRFTAPASAVLRVREVSEDDKVDPVPLETIKAFLTEANGKTLLTAPCSTTDMGLWEKALTPNEHMLWLQGRFVGADEPNRNGAFWAAEDLERGRGTIPYGPLNWLHEGTKIIGCIADQRMVYPSVEAAAESKQPHIAALAPMYRWIYPEEAAVVEMAAERGQLWFSMECIAKEMACIGDNGCGAKVTYGDYLRQQGCEHMRTRSAVRQLIDPTFLGGAVIVPPARPGWADADVTLLRQAASYAEQAAEQMGTSDLPGFEIERLLAQVLRFAGAA